MRDQGLVLALVVISAVWYAYSIQQRDTPDEIAKVQEAVEQWRTQGSYLDYEGHKIFYVDSNPHQKEENLLIIHGFPTSSWDFAHLMPKLTSRFRVITFDMIGYGFSAKPVDFNYSLITQADIAQKILAKQDVNKFHILAHDYGVSVAQELLARQYNKEEKAEKNTILSVVFLNGGLFPSVHFPLFSQKLLVAPVIGPHLHHLMGRGTFSLSLKKIFGPETQPSKFETMVFWELISINGGQQILHKLLGYIAERKVNEERWAAPLANPQLPIHLINGPADPVSGGHVVEYYFNKILKPKDNALASYDLLSSNIGHYPQVEAPEQVLQHLNKFWDKIRI